MNIYQQDIPFIPPDMMQPVTNRQFILRMLNNLQSVYLNQPDFESALVIKSWAEILYELWIMILLDRGFVNEYS